MLRIWIGLLAVIANKMAFAAPVDVRVGIVAYQDFAQGFERKKREKRCREPITEIGS